MQPQTISVYTFCIAFHVYLVSQHRDFKFAVQVDHSKSQPAEDKLSRNGRGHVT